jgi:hypothetical protein
LGKVLIEDEWHDEHLGEYVDISQAMAELKRYAEKPWDQPPNLAPCTSWQTCGRAYGVIEFDDSDREIRRTRILEVTAGGFKWMTDS